MIQDKLKGPINLGQLLRDKLARDYPTVPCKFCSKPTSMTATKLCDPCWDRIRQFRCLSLWQAFKWWRRANS